MNTPLQVTQKIATRAGESSYNATQYLVQGTYRLIIMAPFNTQMGALPLNPPAGLQFLPDQDPTPYIWNSQIITPANGQYTFLITLDRPIEGSQIFVQFILESVPPPPTPQPPPEPQLPPWPPVGGMWPVWHNPYYQDAIRRLHPRWIAELDREIKRQKGQRWYVDAYARPFGPNSYPSGPPDGQGSPDPAAYCWLNLRAFHEWIARQPRP